MEETDKTQDKYLTGVKRRKSLAITSFILGIVPLIFLILEKINLGIFDFLGIITIFIVLLAPIFAIIYGIIALTEKENSSLASVGIILGIITFLLLFFYFFPSSPKPSNTARTMSLANQLRPGISLCCSVPTNQLQDTAGSDICDPAINAILPTYSEFWLANAGDLSYNVTAQCNTDTPTMTITIKNHPKKDCNGDWVVTEIKMTPPPGCR